jgi:hypothetical protein
MSQNWIEASSFMSGKYLVQISMGSGTIVADGRLNNRLPYNIVTCCMKAGILVRLSLGNGSANRVSAATSRSVAAQRLARTGHVSNSKVFPR